MIYSSRGLFEYLHSKSLSGAHYSYREPWALRTGHCWMQLPASQDVLSGSDRGFGTTNGPISTSPGDAARRVRSRGGCQHPAPLCPGSGGTGEGESPSGSPRCPPTHLASPYLLPRPVHPRRSGWQRDWRSCAAAQVSGAGPAAAASGTSRGASPPHRAALPPPRARPRWAGSAPAKRVSPPGLQRGRRASQLLRVAPSGRPLPSLCPAQVILRPDRKHLVKGKNSRRKWGEPSALSEPGLVQYANSSAVLEKGRPLHLHEITVNTPKEQIAQCGCLFRILG